MVRRRGQESRKPARAHRYYHASQSSSSSTSSFSEEMPLFGAQQDCAYPPLSKKRPAPNQRSQAHSHSPSGMSNGIVDPLDEMLSSLSSRTPSPATPDRAPPLPPGHPLSAPAGTAHYQIIKTKRLFKIRCPHCRLNTEARTFAQHLRRCLATELHYHAPPSSRPQPHRHGRSQPSASSESTNTS